MLVRCGKKGRQLPTWVASIGNQHNNEGKGKKRALRACAHNASSSCTEKKGSLVLSREIPQDLVSHESEARDCGWREHVPVNCFQEGCAALLWVCVCVCVRVCAAWDIQIMSYYKWIEFIKGLKDPSLCKKKSLKMTCLLQL